MKSTRNSGGVITNETGLTILQKEFADLLEKTLTCDQTFYEQFYYTHPRVAIEQWVREKCPDHLIKDVLDIFNPKDVIGKRAIKRLFTCLKRVHRLVSKSEQDNNPRTEMWKNDSEH